MQDERAGSGPHPAAFGGVPTSLDGLVDRITCYAADGAIRAGDREIASFVVPVIFSFADPFLIAFDRGPNAGDRIGCFVSGLHPGYVDIGYVGPVSCLQIDFTPIGARLFFKRPMSEFATRLIALEDVGESSLTELHDRLGAAATRSERLRIAVAFLERRLLGQFIDPETDFVWSAIQRSRGNLRVDQLADELGWSRKRLAVHARDAFGLTTKRLARIARFHHAIDLAGVGPRPDWAGIAIDCGYADQAHLVRDFTIFAGTSPERWRSRENESPPKQIFNPAEGDRD